MAYLKKGFIASEDLELLCFACLVQVESVWDLPGKAAEGAWSLWGELGGLECGGVSAGPRGGARRGWAGVLGPQGRLRGGMNQAPEAAPQALCPEDAWLQGFPDVSRHLQVSSGTSRGQQERPGRETAGAPGAKGLSLDFSTWRLLTPPIKQTPLLGAACQAGSGRPAA